MTQLEDRELVAVPDKEATAKGGAPRFRLGVRSTDEGSAFSLGETGPNKQSYYWVYLEGDGATYEIDLLDGVLTLATKTRDAQGEMRAQAVVYKIDVQAMTGQEIKQGDAVQIVFAYDNVRAEEQTTPIKRWVATTGPRHSADSLGRLDTDEIVLKMQANIDEAKELGHFGTATRPPRTATRTQLDAPVPTVSHEPRTSLPDVPGMVDLSTPKTIDEEPVVAETELEQPDDDFDPDTPEPVIVVDPLTGVSYVGRRWRRGQSTTLRSLKSASYRVAVLVLHNGEAATVVLQHPKNLPALQMTSKHGVVRQFLSDKTWDLPLDTGKPLQLDIDSPMDGDREIPRGYVITAPIDELAATGPQAGANVTYPKSAALQCYRNRESELTNGRPLSRNLVA